jgi:hypothetical protein
MAPLAGDVWIMVGCMAAGCRVGTDYTARDNLRCDCTRRVAAKLARVMGDAWAVVVIAADVSRPKNASQSLATPPRQRRLRRTPPGPRRPDAQLRRLITRGLRLGGSDLWVSCAKMSWGAQWRCLPAACLLLPRPAGRQPGVLGPPPRSPRRPAPRRQYTYYGSNCSFSTRYGCAGDFSSYLGLNKNTSWVYSIVHPTGLPTTSNLGVPWAWVSWDCSAVTPFICE